MGLSRLEAQTLNAWAEADEDFGYLAFDQIARASGVDRRRIRRAVRALARKGLTCFGRGLFTEEGTLAGSGYAVTSAGREMLRGKETP